MPYPLINSNGNVAELPVTERLHVGVLNTQAQPGPRQNGDIWYNGSQFYARTNGFDTDLLWRPALPIHAMFWKPSDQSVVNSTTMVDIANMGYWLSEYATFYFELHVLFTASNNPPGVKFNLTVPAGSQGRVARGSSLVPAAAADANLDITTLTDITGGASLSTSLRGYVQTTGQGWFQPRFAQLTANAGATTCRAGSWVIFRRLT